MSSAITPALSSLGVASKRLSVASGNIANAPSAAAVTRAGDGGGFRPLELQQVSDIQGGVRAAVRASNVRLLAGVAPARPDAGANGIVETANVSPEGELGDVTTARHAYQASLAAVSTADKMLGSLFDGEA